MHLPPRSLRWGPLGNSPSSRCGRHEGRGRGRESSCGVAGAEKGSAGTRKRAREHWGESQRQRDAERDTIKQTESKHFAFFFLACFFFFFFPVFLSYPLFAKLEPPRAPPGPSHGSRCESGSSGENASLLGALAHSPTLRSFRRWSEGRARLEPSCLHPLGREERRAGGREGRGREEGREEGGRRRQHTTKWHRAVITNST